jgi:hypothetical protein
VKYRPSAGFALRFHAVAAGPSAHSQNRGPFSHFKGIVNEGKKASFGGEAN